MQVLYPYDITDARLSASSVAEADHAAWAAATVYAVGARVIRTTTHRVYERLTAGASATAPELDEINWIVAGPTNRWAMFDDAHGTATSGASPLSVSLALPGAVNDLVLLGVVGSSVSIVVNSVVVRTVTVPAVAVAGAGATVVITGLGLTGAPTVQINLTGTGTLAIATLAIGTFINIGDTAKSAQIGMMDYGKKNFDPFGQVEIVRRGYSRKIVTPVALLPASMDQIARVLTALRSKSVIWRGLSWVNATVVYGFVDDWSLSLGDGVVTGSVSVKSLAMGL